MYFVKTFGALASISTVVSTSAPVDSDFGHQLATLMIEKGKPTASDLDALAVTLFTSSDYLRIVNQGKLGPSNPRPLPSFRSESPATSTTGVAASSPVGHDVEELESARAEILQAGIEVREEARGKISSVSPPGAGVGAGAPVGLPDVGVVVGAGAGGSADAAPLPDMTADEERITEYIVTTIDAVTHLVVVLNAVNADIKESTYFDLVVQFDHEFSPLLAQLANDAVGRIHIMSETSAARWRDTLWMTHELVTTFVTEKRGFAQWKEFNDKVAGSLQKILDYAIVAQMAGTNAPPPADATTAELKAEVEVQAAQTLCLCVWKCLYKICGQSIDVATTTTTSVPAVAGAAGRPGMDPSRRNAIILVLFIERTVASVESILAEVRSIETSGNADAILNLKLRITLRIMNVVKEAVANDALSTVYDKLKNRSVLLLGTLNGISDPAGWAGVRTSVTSVLQGITGDLNAAKPADIL